MKLTVILLITTFMQISAETYAQRVSFNKKNASIREVIEVIQSQTGYSFIISSDLLRKAAPVNIDLKDIPLKEALDQSFSGQPFEYVINKETIVVSPKKGRVNTLKNAQSLEVTGRITDERGSAVAGANISIKGGQGAATSNDNGNYKIRVPNQGAVILYSFIGFSNQEIKVAGRNVINIVLKPQTYSLEETVVIGYGAVAREDITGSVGQVKMDDLAKAPVGSFDEALAGRIAGVQVSSSDGQPGAGVDITIRGANSLTQSNAPLYVIDGFPIEDPDNAAINPEEIESINVLKDASATAIYGSRGANGVIIIETKKGKAGKPVITLNSSVGFQQAQKRMKMMSTYEFVNHQLEVLPVTAKRLYTPAELDPDDTYYNAEGRTLEDYRNIEGTDWQDLILRNSPMQIHNIAIRGGNEITQYSVSGSIFDQNGIILNTGAKRYQGRISIDQTISKKLKVGITANYSQNTTFGQRVNEGGEGNFTSYLLFRAWAYRPVAGNPDIDLVELDDDPENTSASDVRINPVKSSNNEYNVEGYSSILSNIYMNYDILKNLKLRMTGTVRNNKYRLDRFYNSNTPQGSPRNSSSSKGVNGSFRYSERSNWSNENTLTYNNTFNRYHRVTLLGGFSLQAAKNEVFGFSSQRIPNETLDMYGLDEGIPDVNTAMGDEFGLVSFFGRVNYNYKSKYLFTTTLRADGSSKFAPGHQWGYFPSAALAWNMKREDFMKDVDIISESKLRTSYGVTGNNRINSYAYYTNLARPLTTSYSFNNGAPILGTIISGLGNRDLKWESTEQIDIGYDLGLFKNRFSFTFDFYRKITRDLLLNADMPITTGYLNTFKNIGSIQNTGLEFSLNTVNIQSKSFTWESNFNISFNKNKILALTSNQESMFSTMRVGQDTGPLYIAKIGYPAGMFYGHIFDGIYQVEDFDSPAEGVYVLKSDVPANGNQRDQIQPGHIKYRDISGDGTVDANDRTMIGRGLPIHTGGFSNNFGYKNFSLNVFLQWSYGNQIYNANRIMFEGSYINMFNTNQYASYNERWTPDNRSNTLYKVGGQGPAGYQSTRILEDGSYLRLKTVSLAYSVPKNLIRSLSLSSLDFRVSAQNLLTFTGYSGMDPETSVRNTVLTPGYDYSAYPQARTITFGINATF